MSMRIPKYPANTTVELNPDVWIDMHNELVLLIRNEIDKEIMNMLFAEEEKLWPNTITSKE